VYTEYNVIEFAVNRFLVYLRRVIAQNGCKASLGRLGLDIYMPTV